MALGSKARAALRAEAHHLTPAVQVGTGGITPALITTLDDALRTRELVKVQVGRQAGLGVRDVAQSLAGAVGAEVVQVIGRTMTLYRENPELRERASRS